jgi:glycogen debranching enzyme
MGRLSLRPVVMSKPLASMQPGRPWPMGASVDPGTGGGVGSATGGGVNFAVFSVHATQVDVCVFDDQGRTEIARHTLPARSGDVWHGRLPGAGAGLVYGLRAHGPWRPDKGHRFNAQKLLLDPSAREIVGQLDWRNSPPGLQCGADPDHPQHMEPRDNGTTAYKARVVQDSFDWQSDQRLHLPLNQTVILETHVRGFTKLMPGVPDNERGTYAGLASDAAVAHFKRLGITAISLLPIQQIQDEPRLLEMGLTNYWGYNTLGFFCPDPRYAATQHPRDEFRQMVKRLHAAGLEVLMDVVYNHTPEGDERGPTLSWRGLDNASYYRLPDHQKSSYENWSGCGNLLDIRHPRVLQMVMDSLRYWVQEMHVDGFRFDLAPALGRTDVGFEANAPFFKACLQDPVLAGVKLIAEPWDIGPGGYQVGQFPHGWLEWNDRFRDTTRAFWLGGDCSRGEFALRLAGSSDLFQARRRSPLESVNYVVSHDGFTLADLVSYDMRRNQANAEDNRDGTANNLSWNCGFEGPTTDPEVLRLRERLKRAMLATVLLAQGTPMLAAGDELGHSQGGNNNPYCQDNPITWIDWSRADQDLIDFTAHLLDLRKRLLPFAARWYSGVPDAQGVADLAWLRRSGEPMSAEQWNNRTSRIMGAWIGAPGVGSGGNEAHLLLLFNGRDMDASFQLPAGDWLCELDTCVPSGKSHRQFTSGSAPATRAVLQLNARSVMLLRDQSS